MESVGFKAVRVAQAASLFLFGSLPKGFARGLPLLDAKC